MGSRRDFLVVGLALAGGVTGGAGYWLAHLREEQLNGLSKAYRRMVAINRLLRFAVARRDLDIRHLEVTIRQAAQMATHSHWLTDQVDALVTKGSVTDPSAPLALKDRTNVDSTFIFYREGEQWWLEALESCERMSVEFNSEGVIAEVCVVVAFVTGQSAFNNASPVHNG